MRSSRLFSILGAQFTSDLILPSTQYAHSLTRNFMELCQVNVPNRPIPVGAVKRDATTLTSALDTNLALVAPHSHGGHPKFLREILVGSGPIYRLINVNAHSK